MPLSNFEWEEEIQDVDGVGPCFVGYARDDDNGQWYRIAIELRQLEELAQKHSAQCRERKH